MTKTWAEKREGLEARKARQQTPERKEAQRERDAHARLKKYGLTPERFTQILQSQQGGCAVCGSIEKLVIDHDHACCATTRASCGKCVRGILCSACNSALAFAKDQPGRLRALAAYLEGRI